MSRVLTALVLAGWAMAASAEPLVIAAALDRSAVAPVLSIFEARHPDIELHYADLSTRTVERRVADSHRPPDVVISSAMPAQLRQVNAGYAQRLDSPQARDWPAEAQWRSSVFGFTFEPIVFAYRADLADRMAVPHTHGALYRTLERKLSPLAGRIAVYDPRRSAIGYALYQADADYTAQFWQLVAALGRAHAIPMTDTRAMLQGLSSGRFDFAYNLIGPYARQWAASHPEIQVVVPRDYAVALRRLVFVHRDAEHPQAARTFVNFLLGERGQHLLATRTPLQGLRDTPTAEHGEQFYPILIDAGLMAIADPGRRQRFLQRWRHEFTRSTGADSSPSASLNAAKHAR